MIAFTKKQKKLFNFKKFFILFLSVFIIFFIQAKNNSTSNPNVEIIQSNKDNKSELIIDPKIIQTQEAKEQEQIEKLKTDIKEDLENKKNSNNQTNTQDNKQEPKDSEEANIYLNFENASLSSVVNYLAEQKKINIIPRKELDSINTTLTTRNPMTLDRAWKVLHTLLEMNNFTIINVGNLYRIVPTNQNKQEPLPIYSSGTGTEPEDLPDSDMVVRYIYFLKNIKAETVRNIIVTMLEGDVQTNKDLEACIITDKSLSIKAAMKIIKELDLGGLRESIKIIKLKYVDSKDVADLFKKINPEEKQQTIRFLTPRSQEQSSYFSTDTKIIPEQTRNSLILLGTEKNLNHIIDFIYKYIDIPISATESRLHIREIKYAKAEQLQKILSEIVKPPSGTKSSDFKYFEDVIISTDVSKDSDKPGGNRLIIACGKEDWRRIDKFIVLLDKPTPQVAFEVMIIDTSIINTQELWAQFDPKNGMLGAGITADIRTAVDGKVSLIGQSSPGTNITFGKLAGNPPLTTLWGMIKAVLNKNNYNIITQPFIVTNNYQECEFNTEDEILVNGALSERTVATEPVRKKDTKKASTLVKLTPKVNLNGTIELKINVKVDQFQSRIGAVDPDISNRTLDTRVTIGTGEVLILGGLTRSNLNEKQYKVPILGDIPIIGNLWRSKRKYKEKTNLYIFVRPSIIKPQETGQPDEYTQLKLDYAKYQMINVDSYPRERDPIHRWFFKPGHQPIKQKIQDAKIGLFRPVDEFAYGAQQPKSVNIKKDPYYRTTEALTESANNKKTTNKNIKIKTRKNFIKQDEPEQYK